MQVFSIKMHIFAPKTDNYTRSMQNSTRIRQEAIQEIIQREAIFSQEALALRLQEAGIPSTQATLSRDLKALRISKVPGEGYALPRQSATIPIDLSSGPLRIQFSGNLAVVKTRPGLANAVAALIDNEQLSPILGTIAGDDTILLILRADTTPGKVLSALSALFPDIQNRLVI